MIRAAGTRIPIEEAMQKFVGHLFSKLPLEMREELVRQFLEQARPKGPGLMWWADHAVTVFEEAGGLVVDRALVEQITREVAPVELPPA